MIRPSQHHSGYWAFLVHRISGVGLALFLPCHFWVLGLALNSPDQLNGFLRWSEQPLVKLAETLLVVLLAVHLTGGLRLLVLELFSYNERQKVLISVGFVSPS